MKLTGQMIREASDHSDRNRRPDDIGRDGHFDRMADYLNSRGLRGEAVSVWFPTNHDVDQFLALWGLCSMDSRFDLIARSAAQELFMRGVAYGRSSVEAEAAGTCVVITECKPSDQATAFEATRPRCVLPEGLAPPVDRSAVALTDGSPVTDDHRELRADGQQKGYVVLTAEERAKGFVRPVRRDYVHSAASPKCGALTTMGIALAEIYARDPKFYSGTFCVKCGAHFPLDEFTWAGTTEQVGS